MEDFNMHILHGKKILKSLFFFTQYEKIIYLNKKDKCVISIIIISADIN